MSSAAAAAGSARSVAASNAFVPAWWARGGLAQTLAALRAGMPAPAFATESWATPDGDDLRVHFAAHAEADVAAPLVVLLHGLEGSRLSPYSRQTAALVVERGWRFVVLEFRSCGGVLNRARRTYHSGETTDLAFVVERLVARFPRAPLFAIGFSLGANVLLKWLGEHGERVPANVVAAAGVSPPFDLAASARQCDTRYGGVIARHFLRSLIPKALAKARQFPGYCDVAAVRRCRTLRAFDDLVTAPVHGFGDAAHYYATQSCGPFVPAIRRPTLLLAAADDPLCRADLLPPIAALAADSPFLQAGFTPHGGHVGFVSGGTPWRPRRWAEAFALGYFAQVLRR